MLSSRGKISVDGSLKYFSYFSKKMGFDKAYFLEKKLEMCFKMLSAEIFTQSAELNGFSFICFLTFFCMLNESAIYKQALYNMIHKHIDYI